MDEITNEPSKKEAAKEERRRRKELLAGASAAAVSAIAIDQPDPLSSNYGDVELNDLQSKSITGRKWTEVGSNIPELKDQAILIRGRVHTIRPVIKKMAFVVVRERGFTAQCVLNVKPELVSLQMVKFATSLNKESIVDIEGSVSIPAKPITGCTQQQKGEQLVHVNQDTRLNFRILDIRTPANQGIFRIQCQVENIFRQFLLSEGFVGIHTPKLIGGSSEGGSAVFRLDYTGQPACLAQSPQLHKQMAICGDFGRYLQKTLRLTFAEGVRMLKEAGVEVDPLGDLNTESERKLGQLVAEKYLITPLPNHKASFFPTQPFLSCFPNMYSVFFLFLQVWN
ncbi:Aspartate--tRNA ligase, cytoplasmic [Capsicum chinense]|nr:Aspartate--tRNA ligase, cytoplasmic [Capsicum chinense]